MKKTSLICAMIGLMLVITGCKKELDMTVLTKVLLEDEAFDALYVEDAWNVTVVQDSVKRGVELEYSAFLEDYLQITKEGSAVNMRLSQRLNLPAATVKNATVYVSSIRQILLKEAATVDLLGSFAADSLVVDLKEATTLRGGSFTGDLTMRLDEASSVVDFSAEGTTCTLSLKDASVFKGILSFSAMLDLFVSDASRMTTYGGTTPVAAVSVEEAGFLNMTQTIVDEMNIHLSSASEASVYVVSLLEGTVHDASTLYHAGSANLYVDCDDLSSIHPL